VSANRYLIGAQALAAPQVEHVDEEPSDDELASRAVVEIEAAIERQLPKPRYLPSELEGVSDEAWTQWVQAMQCTEPTTVSESGALGMFGIKPRRLADLGLMKDVEATNAPKTRRMGWRGQWVPPMTQDAFLGNLSIQYRVLVASTKLYAAGIEDGSIACPEGCEDMTLSGALALLHRCGPKALERWADVSSRKPSTVDLFERTNDRF